MWFLTPSRGGHYNLVGAVRMYAFVGQITLPQMYPDSFCWIDFLYFKSILFCGDIFSSSFKLQNLSFLWIFLFCLLDIRFVLSYSNIDCIIPQSCTSLFGCRQYLLYKKTMINQGSSHPSMADFKTRSCFIPISTEGYLKVA